MNFLVTGGAGFIGSHVCERLLRDGHSVWAFDDLNNHYDPQLKRRNLREVQAVAGGCAVAAGHRRRGSAAATKLEDCRPFEFVHGDITDRAALDGIFSSVKFDQVIHLAARAGVRPSLADPALYQRVNVEGTVNVLEAARTNRRQKNHHRLVVVGLWHEFQNAVQRERPDFFRRVALCREQAGLRSARPRLASHLRHGRGMLRFFTVYGPRQRPDLVIYKFAKLISAGKPIPVFGDGSAARDYTFITDTLDGIIACTQKEFGYELFNLGESQTVKLDYLIELLEKSLGKKAMIDRQPVQPGDVPITFADISKARAKLGYHPRVKIEQGIPKFVDWFLKSNG